MWACVKLANAMQSIDPSTQEHFPIVARDTCTGLKDGNGTAVSDQAYTSDYGTLTFAPGQTSNNIPLWITDDDLDEEDVP